MMISVVGLVVSLTMMASTTTTTTMAQSSSSFEKDVVGRTTQKHAKKHTIQHGSLRNDLLAKAIPLAEFTNNKMDAFGNPLQFPSSSSYLLQQQQQRTRNLEDYFDNNEEMFSFSGYSMKYAHCQPVQYFSEDAIQAGDHSPMITEDIVVLRLCPRSSCSSTQQYGCHYNFAEYALSLTDYLTIMLKYSVKKQQDLCDYCEMCGYEFQEEEEANDDGGGRRRHLDEAVADEVEEAEEDGVEGENAEEDGQVENEDNLDEDQPNDDENAEQENAADEGQDQNEECAYASTYCSDFNTVCAREDDSSYLSYEEYLDYLECGEVVYNDYAYFVRPRCDGYSGSIKMAAYYDNYCVQQASGVSVKDLGLGFREGFFSEYYNGTCIDCAESNEVPYYDINSAVCNKLHGNSAKCTSNLLYDLFGGEGDDTTECSFIESIRFGTYDEEGKLSSASSALSWSTEVSTGQKIMLSISMAFCVAFIIYACYLHHAMTNLLIKSLSHRELLPPSRQFSARRSRSVSRQQRPEDADGNGWTKGSQA